MNGNEPGKRKRIKSFGITEVLTIATWNIQGLNNKEPELIKTLEERKINIAIISETKKKLKGTKEIDDWIMIYSGVTQSKRAQAGVAIYIDKRWKHRIISYNYINERLLTLRLKVKRGNMTVIATYAPEEGKKEETEIFKSVFKLNQLCSRYNFKISTQKLK